MEVTKKVYTFQIVIEKEPEADYFTAYSPSVAGCFRRGATAEEAKEGVRQALQQRLAAMLARGEAVLESEKFLRVDELTIAAGPAPEEGQPRAVRLGIMRS